MEFFLGEMCMKKKFIQKVFDNNKNNHFAFQVALTEAGSKFINRNETILETPTPSICKLLDTKE